MFVVGTHIQTNAFGDTASIESLESGSTIYDPIAAKTVDVVQTMSRRVELSTASARRKLALSPFALRTRASRVGNSHPVLASPQQQFLHAIRSDENEGPAAAELLSTLELAHLGLAYRLQEVDLTYVALFTETQCYMCVASMIALTYGIEELNLRDQISRFARCQLAGGERDTPRKIH